MLDSLFTHLSVGIATSRPADLSSLFRVFDVLMLLAAPLLAYGIFAKRRVIEAARRMTAPAVAARLVAGPTTLVGVATVEEDNDDDPIVLVSEQTGQRATPSGAWIWTETGRQVLDRPFYLVLDGDARRVRVAPEARVKLLALLEAGSVTASSDHEAHRRVTARLRRGERARISGVLSFEPTQNGYRGEEQEPVLRPAPDERLVVQATSSAAEVYRGMRFKHTREILLVLAVVLNALALAPALYLRAAGTDVVATIKLPRDPHENAVPATVAAPDGALDATPRVFWFVREELPSHAASGDVVQVRFDPSSPELYCLRGQWGWGHWSLLFLFPMMLVVATSFAYTFAALPDPGPYYDDKDVMTCIVSPRQKRTRGRADS